MGLLSNEQTRFFLSRLDFGRFSNWSHHGHE